MSFLSRLFGKQPAEPEILNTGLQLAIEFCGNRLKPVQQGLFRKYKFLSKDELDKYHLICKAAIADGVQFINDMLHNLDSMQQTANERELKKQLSVFMQKKYPWINGDGVERLFNHSGYYSWKAQREQRMDRNIGFSIS